VRIVGEFWGGGGEGGYEGVEEVEGFGGEDVRVLVFFVGAEGVERGEVGNEGGARLVVCYIGRGEGRGGVKEVPSRGDLVNVGGEALILEDGGDYWRGCLCEAG